MKLDKKDILHIIVIILGIIFVAIPIFHENLWFDESYSVGLANHTFTEIWTIGGNDVHPILYYWILHIINLIFENKIICYRLFSLVCISILGILGFTHIRKDFGKNVGLIFSFLVFFLPVNMVYTGEIRMYALAMLLVTLMCIYAYRVYKNRDKKQIKNWILFAIFSLASAYTHYYALATAGIVNLMLFVFFTKEAVKEKKITNNLKMFFAIAIPQIILYIPWIVSLLLQVKQVSSGFWISIKFPDSLIEFFNFQFTGNLGGDAYVNPVIAGIFGILICAYMIYANIKNKSKEEKPEKLAILIWGILVLAICLVSLIIWRPIIYARYMLCVTGLFIFFLSYTMAEKGNKYITIAICIISLILSIFVQVKLIQTNYDESNNKHIEYIRENIQKEDIILHKNNVDSFVLDVNFLDNKVYFWNKDNWNVEQAYKAFGYNFKTCENIDELKNYKGRIWLIDSSEDFTEEIKQELENVQIVETKSYNVKYHNLHYTITLVEKD